MKGNPFENQLEQLARTPTEQFGVSVACQSDNARTDGEDGRTDTFAYPTALYGLLRVRAAVDAEVENLDSLCRPRT